MEAKEAEETIADIVAEIRKRDNLRGGDMVDNFHIEADYGEYGGWDGLELIKAYADRFEAAAKRERGNAAAMREALESCLDFIMRIDRAFNPFMQNLLEDAISKAKAALSAPQRNCDVMDWRTAWAKWRTENHPQKPVGYSECYESTTMFMDWYTGTEERKGEGDEK